MGGARMSFYGKCPNCGHCAPKQLSKSDEGFGEYVLDVASQLTGVPYEELTGTHGQEDVRNVRAGVARYLSHNMTWRRVGEVMGGRTPQGAWNLERRFRKAGAIKVYRMLLEAIEVTD